MTTTDGRLLLIACVQGDPGMANRFQAMFETPVELINIHDFDAKQQADRGTEVDAVLVLDNQIQLIPDLHKFRNLRLVLDFSVGYENFSTEMIPDGCLFVNTFEHQQPIADWVIMVLLMLSRDAMSVEGAFRNQTLRAFAETGGMKLDMSDATIGVIGYGHIGREIVRKCRLFESKCLVTMRNPISNTDASSAGIDRVYPMAGLHEMLAESDFVIPAIPATPQVTGMFGAEEFRIMKDSAFIINIARAELLDERATYNALKERTIAGAALDVWWNEQPVNLSSDDPEHRKWSSYPFWELDNVIMSPHWSSLTTAMLRRKFTAMALQVDRLNRGEPLINVIPELSKASIT